MKKNIREGDTHKEVKREREGKPKFENPKNMKKGVTHKEKSMKTGLERDDRGKRLYFYICFLFKVGLY